ncbi:MAG TPA: HU family DNA-binding protein [Candidatus Baltobacteraceae bacterium]|nr:HU family DNA-binding protein [Candidatus Baltobacteraceae bacterium]
MTKADIVDAIASEAQLSKRVASEIIEVMLREIKSALQRGERVALTPFGSFVVRQRRGREGRNPKTGAAIDIPPRSVPAFVAGKGLREAVTGRSRAKKNGAAHKGGNTR